MKKLIFVSGTGRSGTHLIGRSLSNHPEIEDRIEVPNTFNLITSIAINQDIRNIIYIRYLKQKLKKELTKIIKESSKPIILEKSHPSLWIFEFIIKNFEEAFFIGVWRDVFPTVSSMLQHDGVLSWYNRLPQNKQNRFLGITNNNKNKFNKYSIEEKCALRWQSHYKELMRLNKKYPEKLYLIKYEDFLNSSESYLQNISEYLNISNQFLLEPFNMHSQNKWKKSLTVGQINKIEKILINNS